MKRRFTSILLFSALLMGGASTFVSCKDYESDTSYQVNGTIADQLKAQTDKLNNLIQLLDDVLKDANNATDVDNNINKIVFGKDANGNAITWDKAKEAVLESALASAKEEAAKAQAAAEQTSKDYTDQQIATLANEILNINKSLSDLKNAVEANKTELNSLISANTDAINELKEQMGNKVDQSTYNQFVEEVTYMIEQAETNSTMMYMSLQNQLSDLEENLNEDTNRIKALEEALDKKASSDDLTTLKTELENEINALNSKIDNIDHSVYAKASDLDDLKNIVETVKTQVEANAADIATNKAAIEAIQAELVNYATKDELNDKASALEAAFKAADTALESKIQAQIDEVNEKLNKLFNAMASMVTGIELQATSSPITGYENLSFLGVEAHILGAYYGKAEKNVTIGNESIYTDEWLIDETTGKNAGSIYVTINPSNIDFSGLTFKIVDSQGNEAPFTATAKKSDRVLKYGVSRASSNSNLYELEINLPADKISEAKTWTSEDASNLKSAAKNVLDKLRKPGTNRLNVADIASTIEQTFNNRLTAYGLQLKQEVENTNGTKTERYITSKLSLAATAIKPLSYTFLADNSTLKNLDLPSIPTLQSKLNFNNYKFNWTPIESIGDVKTSITLEGMPDLDNITINGSVIVPEITVQGDVKTKDGKTSLDVKKVGDNYVLDLTQLNAEAAVKIDDITIDKNNVKITIPQDKTQSYDVTIPMDEFNKIVDNINSQVGDMVANVNNAIDKVNGYCSTIDDNYISRVNSYIQKFENVLRKSNSLLQPTILYTTSTGSWNQLPTVEEAASYLKLDGGKASTVFVATSYTAEMLAPAYKKYVHVTSQPAGSTVSGSHLNEVVDGNVHKIGFEANKEGTYEITYEAVDYTGHKTSRKFYVKVVK